SHSLLDKITKVTIEYLKMQVDAGANMLQLFDSWAGILGPEQYREFSLKYIQEICNQISSVPLTVFAKGAFFARKEFGSLKCRTIGLDWNMNIKESRSLIGPDKTLQGNLDPCVLYTSEKKIAKHTRKMLEEFRTQKYIANLGHGVYPDTDASKVKFFVEVLKEESFRLREQEVLNF